MGKKPHQEESPPGKDGQVTGVPGEQTAMLADRATTVLGPAGAPEVHLANLHRYASEPTLRQLLVVQYDPQQFVARADHNEKFRVDVEAWAEEHGRRGTPGALSTIPQGIPTDVQCREADGEAVMRTGERAAIIFLTLHPSVRLLATREGATNITAQTDLMVQMPLRVCLDLLKAWKSLADELRSVFDQ
ncbi:MAG TPA: hypothetical protein RMH85_06685 [Polyangiaceae bacterium LLY-WYZ-15_(1-7)]|nr:hypothetical protein [Myxococcales bacterium]MAT24241.1 hypothetical protein [Sandaracinus sp.]HJL03747.1 hypothetical protein [Polyangiaceae bacterium LLY-WYZ-15_(1-7)]MBJ71937.1 hypothetical protein [Sandaracinus sp.]HJL08163.1 hypothetical protein [Polyangiaceae bacterium LLY-WYZ-15_(1-7)]